MNFIARDRKLQELGFRDYPEYLKSEHWRNLRVSFLKSTPPPEVCNRCRVLWWACRLVYGQELHLHHKTYERLGEELLDDMELVCRRCHDMHHLGESALPKIVLRACQNCRRPKITFDPAIPASEISALWPKGRMESVADIIQRWRTPKRRQVFTTEKRRTQLEEIMSHPQCEVREKFPAMFK